MNIPTKVLRSTFITYETYFHHQQLAKKFYKSSSKTSKKHTKQNTPDSETKNYEPFQDHISYVISDPKHNFKEELLKW